MIGLSLEDLPLFPLLFSSRRPGRAGLLRHTARDGQPPQHVGADLLDVGEGLAHVLGQLRVVVVVGLNAAAAAPSRGALLAPPIGSLQFGFLGYGPRGLGDRMGLVRSGLLVGHLGYTL